MNKQAGFTLIEIIAVLVILGILAAVAIPKYQDLQEQAEIKAAQGVAAAGVSYMNMVYARRLLETNGDTVTAAADASGADCGPANVAVEGGFTLACAAGVATATGPSGQTATAQWTAP